MSKTWDDDGSGRCKHCSLRRDEHEGAKFGDKGDTCANSRAYVWRRVGAAEEGMARAAIVAMQDFYLATDYKLCLVSHGAAGDDDWSHAYGYDDRYRGQLALIMHGGAGKYTTTLREMATAWDFFCKGWAAHRDAPPAPKPKKARVSRSREDRHLGVEHDRPFTRLPGK